MNNFGLRVLSAVVLGGLVLLVTYFGGLLFHLMIALFAGALLYEWLAMVGDGLRLPTRLALWALLLIGLVPLVFNMDAAVVVFVALVAMGCGIGLEARRSGTWVAGGLVYALVAAVSIHQIREGGSSGLAAIVFLFSVVWATDSFAYVFGRLIGGRKLAPRISPSKTWSGALGGALAAVIAGTGSARLMGLQPGFVLAMAALVLSAVSQAGDLFESAVKRRFGVKDSGNMIPGHGGVMDRVDGLVAAGLALYLIGLLVGGIHEPSRGLFYLP
ncbi:phosphatidate cytidylyltransferase [Tianweitania sediminis]|uniref:Phosphatidate cytidylyltransferase n=1 Tax=Tianweitania sediminis TaxID=1502156 RepID=A0A8J7R1D7_9HYPH|nr:phosphatidate cytidylyltransferase [Tianweitania sediminis]